MLKISLIPLIFFFAIFFVFGVSKTLSETKSLSASNNERLVIKALQTIASAQIAYQSTAGNGNFGSILDLQETGYIDSDLASGEKYGYYFLFANFDGITTTLPRFYVIATPSRYKETGEKSFYVDENGEIHGADKNGKLATVADPVIDGCSSGSISENETCTIAVLRSITGAQMTYQSTSGSGSFGSLKALSSAKLITRSLSGGFQHGYVFTVITTVQTLTKSAGFRILAVPKTYGVTGTRSFYIGMDGVVIGTDKKGKPADENDLPIEESKAEN
jgi:hypothetical protein